MKYYKFFLILFFTGFVATLNAQTLSEADALYKAGEYSKAKIIYVLFADNDRKAADRYEKCLELEELYNYALDSLFYKERYKSTIQYCERILDVNPDCAKTKKLKERSEKAIEELIKKREEELNEARIECSVVLLNRFREKYSKQEEPLRRADQIEQDMTLWLKAKSVGTKNAYNDYLANTKYGWYKEEALDAIGNLDYEAAWQKVKDSRDADALNRFMKQYAKYNTHQSEINAMLQLIECNKLFEKAKRDERKYAEAYSTYQKISNSRLVKLNDIEEQNYLICRFYRLYADTPNNENSLKDYAMKYPSSPWAENARKRAQNLEDTRVTKEKKERISSYGKFFTFGISAGYDLSVSDTTYDLSKGTHYFSSGTPVQSDEEDIRKAKYSTGSIGVRMRFGRPGKKFNVVTGADYHFGNVSRLAVPLLLRWNCVPEAFYLGAGYEYQYVFDNILFHNDFNHMIIAEAAIYDRSFELGARMKFGVGGRYNYNSIGLYLTYYFGAGKK